MILKEDSKIIKGIIIELDEICNLLDPDSDKFSADICTPELLLWDTLILLFIIDLDKDKKPLFENIKLLLLLWFGGFCGLFTNDVLFLLFIEKWEDSTCIFDDEDILIYGVADCSS